MKHFPSGSVQIQTNVLIDVIVYVHSTARINPNTSAWLIGSTSFHLCVLGMHDYHCVCLCVCASMRVSRAPACREIDIHIHVCVCTAYSDPFLHLCVWTGTPMSSRLTHGFQPPGYVLALKKIFTFAFNQIQSKLSLRSNT